MMPSVRSRPLLLPRTQGDVVMGGKFNNKKDKRKRNMIAAQKYIKEKKNEEGGWPDPELEEYLAFEYFGEKVGKEILADFEREQADEDDDDSYFDEDEEGKKDVDPFDYDDDDDLLDGAGDVPDIPDDGYDE